MALPGRNELQDLVDNPNEALDCEVKSWLDLGDMNVRASIARHIAALANHGGGSLVAGFTDATPHQFAGPNPYPTPQWDRDTVASIVKKYLEPTFQCEVRMVRSAAGNDHPVILVPPHGAVPICAKASGPADATGKPTGITQGTYYTRKPGPESAPVTNAAEWAAIIRRCSMHDRASVLNTIGAVLRGVDAVPMVGVLDQALRTFHEATHAEFLADVKKRGLNDLASRHFQLSYAIDRADAQELEPHDLKEIVRQINEEARDLVNTSFSMIRIVDRSSTSSFYNSDAKTGQGERDFLECRLPDNTAPGGAVDASMWRVTPTGMVTLIRGYVEDHPDLNNGKNWRPGTWLSPNLLAPALAEFVRHARAFAERFAASTSVSFRCEWHGLEGRMVADPYSDWSVHPAARMGQRTATGSWPVTALASEWPKIVAHLGAPLARTFDITNVFTPQWILGQAPKWLAW
jgi:hypothetical protein